MIGRLALVAASQLDELFEVWLFTPSKPEGIETASALTARTAARWAACRRACRSDE
jgi:hypothetical protein